MLFSVYKKRSDYKDYVHYGPSIWETKSKLYFYFKRTYQKVVNNLHDLKLSRVYKLCMLI